MLICKFASERSSRARIESYLAYLRDMEQRQVNDPQGRQVVETLLLQAQSWVRRGEPT